MKVSADVVKQLQAIFEVPPRGSELMDYTKSARERRKGVWQP